MEDEQPIHYIRLVFASDQERDEAYGSLLHWIQASRSRVAEVAEDCQILYQHKLEHETGESHWYGTETLPSVEAVIQGSEEGLEALLEHQSLRVDEKRRVYGGNFSVTLTAPHVNLEGFQRELGEVCGERGFEDFRPNRIGSRTYFNFRATGPVSDVLYVHEFIQATAPIRKIAYTNATLIFA